MAKDPICGMTVDESSPLRAERDGQTYYFCSEHCRKKFVEQAQPVQSIPTAPVSKDAGSASHAQARSFPSRPRSRDGKTLGRCKILLPDVSRRGVG